ncbi:MAG: hypothetical protein NPMRTH4_450009 [Nitrosopumilales archaeon]|nr:MAG: hypothetical protein NPMRTH4_450009 [Nitrosopumilales archaeon]
MSGNDFQTIGSDSHSDHSISQNKSENKMSKQQTQSTNDVFAVCAKNFDKIHSTVEKNTPQYLQSFTSLQQEYLATWSSIVHSTIALQQNFANKIGMNTNAPENTNVTFQDVTEGIIKAIDVQSKIVQTALDTTKQNIKTINDNASNFAELNQNIINAWITVWKTNN